MRVRSLRRHAVRASVQTRTVSRAVCEAGSSTFIRG
jgi:hypothetical protein